MKLTDYEREMFDGVHGRAKAQAMDLLVRYGEALDAECLVETNNVAGGFGGVNFGLIIDSTSVGNVSSGANSVVGGFVCRRVIASLRQSRCVEHVLRLLLCGHRRRRLFRAVPDRLERGAHTLRIRAVLEVLECQRPGVVRGACVG